MDRVAIINARVFRPQRDAPGATLEDRATVLVQGDRIVEVGPSVEIPAQVRQVDAGGRLVTPGLVDAHTHPVFVGDRADEFCARAAGASYLEIARAGGGILSTVRATRAASDADLLETAGRRLARLLRGGVTTVEAKTGYGLSIPEELRQLRILRELARRDAPRVRPTLLAAHAIPPEASTPEQRATWVFSIANEMIPFVAREKLAGRIDAFVEQGAYLPAEARALAESARWHGLAVHLHVDQLTAGQGAQLAAQLGAQAVAHLERVDPEGIQALAVAGTVAILLPTATLAAREPAYAPARRLVEAGVRIALSTNLNPGTAPTESVPLTLFLAAVGLGLTPVESLWAFTRGGALALGEDALGLIEPGALADLVVWNATNPAHLAYHAGVDHVREVWLGGRQVVDRTTTDGCDGSL